MRRSKRINIKLKVSAYRRQQTATPSHNRHSQLCWQCKSDRASAAVFDMLIYQLIVRWSAGLLISCTYFWMFNIEKDNFLFSLSTNLKAHVDQKRSKVIDEVQILNMKPICSAKYLACDWSADKYSLHERASSCWMSWARGQMASDFSRKEPLFRLGLASGIRRLILV